MKKTFVFLLFLLPLALCAQPTPFGYFSFNEMVKLLPGYESAQKELKGLQGKYDAEIKRSEEELTIKYVDFLRDQSNLPDNIRNKRQKELQELMERNIAFKEEVRATLSQARDSLFLQLEEAVKSAVKWVCIDKGLSCIVNTDNNNYLYLNDAKGALDVTLPVKVALGIAPPPVPEPVKGAVVSDEPTVPVPESLKTVPLTEGENKSDSLKVKEP